MSEIKNCLIYFKNKKINELEGVQSVIDGCSANGYFFDRVYFVAYDSSAEIISAVKDGVANYRNVLLYCPDSMENTLKNYFCELLKCEFDDLNVLRSGELSVYLITVGSDIKSRVEYFCKSLSKKYGVNFNKAYIKCVGAPSAKINSAIIGAKELCPALSVNVKGKYGECSIELVYDDTVKKAEFDAAFRKLAGDLQEYLYALEDVTLVQRFVDLLKLRRMVISVAESFTGGGIGRRLVEISGVSEVYFEGLNTYSNEAKMQRLGVREETLKSFGAVSKETAFEMAQGLLKSGNCNVCIATTGIAGPNSDNTKKPVGLAYIAVGVDDDIKVYEYNLKGSRKQITETAVNLALFLAFKTLK